LQHKDREKDRGKAIIGKGWLDQKSSEVLLHKRNEEMVVSCSVAPKRYEKLGILGHSLVFDWN
jgi:hypothetical protein